MINKLQICLLLSTCILAFTSCREQQIILKPVSYAQFETFVDQTEYITDAEKYGWSIVQLDVFNFKTMDDATWRKPNGIDGVESGDLPVTQVSYNDAVAYCKWSKSRLPSYEEYWEIVKGDTRDIVYDNKSPISNVSDVNVVGNVWEITEVEDKESEKKEVVRLAGGSLFCSEKTCHGIVKDRELFVDRATGNIHIGFCVIAL